MAENYNSPDYVEFNVTSGGQPVSNALISLSGAATGSVTTDVSGHATLLINATAMGAQQSNNVLTFTQLGSSNMSYNIMSPSGYTFSGIFRDELNNIGIVQGTSTISIGAVASGPMRYDTNVNGRIEKNEAIQGVIDYFSGIITRQEAIEVVVRYFSG